jgi:hypothetical protein
MNNSLINYIFLFLFGGILFVLIKYLSTYVDIKYSSFIAAFPIGLLATILILDNNLLNYSYNYSVNCLILLIAAVVQYVLLISTNSRYLSLIVAMLIWAIINYIYIII